MDDRDGWRGRVREIRARSMKDMIMMTYIYIGNIRSG